MVEAGYPTKCSVYAVGWTNGVSGLISGQRKLLLLTVSILAVGPKSHVSSNIVAIVLFFMDRGMKATTWVKNRGSHISTPPRGLRRMSAADRLLGLRVRISPETWMPLCYECCALSGRGPCDGPIPNPEETYRL